MKITAEVHSDDFAKEVSFDATSYFEQADSSDLIDLMRCQFRGDYPADNVAKHFEDINDDIAELMAYCVDTHLRLNPDHFVGFECVVDYEQAVAWIQKNRPQLQEHLEKYCGV